VHGHRVALAADAAPDGPRRGDAVFKRILVPLDLSRRNQRTLDTARELAQLHRARVTLLHVVHQIPDLAASELSDFYRRLERLVEDRQRTIFESVGHVQPAPAVGVHSERGITADCGHPLGIG